MACLSHEKNDLAYLKQNKKKWHDFYENITKIYKSE